MVGLRRLPHANHDTLNNIESYHGVLKSWLIEFTRGASKRKLDWFVWHLTISIISHDMYIEEHNFKGFIPKKIEAIVDKGIENTRNIRNDDVLQPTSLDNRWIVKSQTPTILTQRYFLKVIVDRFLV